MRSAFVAKILELGEKQNITELEEILSETSTNELTKSLEDTIDTPDAYSFWNYLLNGLYRKSELRGKRFKCVMKFLEKLSTIEFGQKHSELVKRLCLELSTFSNKELIEIAEHCIECIRSGDSKYLGWKDLLPEIISLLSSQSEVTVNDIKKNGNEYRTSTISNITTMKWSQSILTPLASMFQKMPLNNQEITTILTKFCSSLQKCQPLELPALAYQLFTICQSAGQIIIPIMGFQRYFHRYFYRKQLTLKSNESSDLDSIDSEEKSEKEIRESQETILHHLNYCTQFKMNEQQITATLRGLTASTELILTPFIISSLLSMTKANRDPDAQIPISIILPFLRNTIKFNEDEKMLSDKSAWCRDILKNSQVDLEQIFTILIDQNKEGKDVVTPGLVNLAFTLLRTKNSPKLNNIGIMFLQKFIRKRFVFGQGIVENLIQWMIVDQEDTQYAECLTILSLNDTFTVSECTKSIKNLLDCFLKIPGERAMRMMYFILPVVKISHPIRDTLIETLKKAMYSRIPETCQMGVYGFCNLLKQLNSTNSQRFSSNPSSFFTQPQTISGFSMQSQCLMDKNNPRRHFDILALEIIGLLRNCFHSNNLKIKETLYENLFRAVELNPKLTPHVLGFINEHFQTYLDVTDFDEILIKFNEIVTETNEHQIEVKELLGNLTMLLSFCVIKCEIMSELEYNTGSIRRTLSKIVERICNKSMDLMEPGGILDHHKNELALQKLNVLEALMFYEIWTSTRDNDGGIANVLKLFKIHRNLNDAIKSMQCQGKKTIKKGKASQTHATQTQNITVNGTAMKKVVFNPQNIWDLPTIERFLRLCHENEVSFAKSENTESLRSNRDLVRYVLKTAINHAERLRMEPDYKQITHSRRIFQYLIAVTRVVFERCIKRLPELWKDFDVQTAFLCVEYLHQSLLTVKAVFQRKADAFFKELDLTSTQSVSNIMKNIQVSIEKTIEDETELNENQEGKKISVTLLQCLDTIYEIISYKSDILLNSYSWILKFCQNNELTHKDLGIANKILFKLRLRTHTGEFFNAIAINLQDVIGKINEEETIDSPLKLKSITEGTAESCFLHLLGILRKQIEDVEYFITKANSFHFKLKMGIDDDHDKCIQEMKSLERGICSQLAHVSNALFHVLNICIPLGSCMNSLERVLMNLYISLTNLAKHFIVRQGSLPSSFQGTKFEHLLKVAGKPLAERTYHLITYIEANINEGGETQQNKNFKPELDKAKVMKETRFLPKLILRMETFNKLVIQLSKKTKAHFAHYLHIGIVRDFRIKTNELKEAIGQNSEETDTEENDEISVNSKQNEDDNEQMNTDNQLELENTILDQLEEVILNKSPVNLSDSEEEPSPEVIRRENEEESNKQVIKNLKKLNVKSKQKSLKKDKENVGTSSSAEEPEPKRRRGRPVRENK